jgi:acyl-CoA dehydrogenase
MTLLTLGGDLKRKEMLSARFGDILSELYLLSAAWKRWEDEGRQASDLPLLEWCMASGFATIETRLDEIFANFPSRSVAGLLRFILLPFGKRHRGPSDALTQACAAILLEPSAARDRLTVGLFHGSGDEGVARLDRAFAMVIATQASRDRMRKAHVHDIAEARTGNLLNDAEAAQLQAAEQAVAAVIEVDDFAADELSPRRGSDTQADVPSPTVLHLDASAAE